MRHTIEWDEELHLVRVAIVGLLSPEEAMQLAARMKAMAPKTRARMVLDDTAASHVISAEVRGALRQAAPDLDYERISAFGFSNLNRIVARIVTTLAGRSDRLRFFATEAEAVAWACEED